MITSNIGKIFLDAYNENMAPAMMPELSFGAVLSLVLIKQVYDDCRQFAFGKPKVKLG